MCCKDLWYLEVEPPQQAGRVSLVRASTASLELTWPATLATNTYILEIQKLPPTASPSPVSTPTPLAAQPTPVAATASPVTMLNSGGNVYRLQKSGGATVQQPVRVIGTPASAKLGAVLGKAAAGGHQVVSVVKGAQFVSPIVGKAAGSATPGSTVQRTTTLGGIKQITSGSLIQQQTAGGNIVTVSPQQAGNLVGQKIVLQKSTLQQFQQQGTGQKVAVGAGVAGAAGGGPQIVKLVKTAQGTVQVQGATAGTKVVNPATGKIIQMAPGQQFFTINKSSGTVTATAGSAGGVAGSPVQKRIITTGPGGGEQQIIMVSQSPTASGTATTGARGPIKIQTMAGGTKQFTIGGKPVTVQLGGVAKRPLTIMTPQAGASAAGGAGSIISAQAAGSATGQATTAGGQQILILPSGQGSVLTQSGGVLKTGSVLQQGAGRKSFIQIVGGAAGATAGQQTTVGGQKIMPRIVINQSQQLQQQQGGQSGSSSNIEQLDGACDGECGQGNT